MWGFPVSSSTEDHHGLRIYYDIGLPKVSSFLPLKAYMGVNLSELTFLAQILVWVDHKDEDRH